MRSGFFNLPNLLSLSRIAMAVCFVAFGSTRIRLILLFASALTDVLDGWLARRSHLVSRSGALVDAIADRLFVLSAVAALAADGLLTVLEALLVLSRDIMTVTGFIVARVIPWLRQAVFKARLVGKAVTVLQYLVLAAALEWRAAKGGLLVVTALASTIAVVDYTLALWRARALHQQ